MRCKKFGQDADSVVPGVLYKGVSTSAAAPMEPPLVGEEDDVFRWRSEQFRELGFDGAEASELASSPADLGQARYLLANGCRPRLALAILL
jgi:hypothetical protein